MEKARANAMTSVHVVESRVRNYSAAQVPGTRAASQPPQRLVGPVASERVTEKDRNTT